MCLVLETQCKHTGAVSSMTAVPVCNVTWSLFRGCWNETGKLSFRSAGLLTSYNAHICATHVQVYHSIHIENRLRVQIWKQVSKVIWQRAALPPHQPLQWHTPLQARAFDPSETPKNAHSRGESGFPGYLGAHKKLPTNNGTSIGSSVFAQLTRHIDTQTHRWTLKRVTHVTADRIYAMHLLRRKSYITRLTIYESE